MAHKLLLSLSLFTMIIVASSCNYHCGSGMLASRYDTISVPYVSGDGDGDLTAAIIEEMTRTSGMQYRKYCGQLVLNVCVLGIEEEDIGFRYDHDDDDLLTDNLIPIEMRMKALAEVEVVDVCAGCVVVGPTKVMASIDYDHEYNQGGENLFSLGQLNDTDAARDISYHPLNRAPARRIVDLVINSW